jgi:hypothetical protein
MKHAFSSRLFALIETSINFGRYAQARKESNRKKKRGLLPVAVHSSIQASQSEKSGFSAANLSRLGAH